MVDDEELQNVSDVETQTWGDRLLVAGHTLSPRHRKLCELAAQGLPNREIAKQLDYTDSRVSILLSNTQIRNEIDRIRERIYEDTIGRRLKDLARPALDELERCLGDKTNKYKENLKVDVAKWLVEKIDGKAIQKHDIGENLLSVMMDRLDAIKRSGQSTLPRPPEQRDVIEAQAKEVNQDQEPAIQTLKTEEELLKDWCTDFSPVKNT